MRLVGSGWKTLRIGGSAISRCFRRICHQREEWVIIRVRSYNSESGAKTVSIQSTHRCFKFRSSIAPYGTIAMRQRSCLLWMAVVWCRAAGYGNSRYGRHLHQCAVPTFLFIEQFFRVPTSHKIFISNSAVETALSTYDSKIICSSVGGRLSFGIYLEINRSCWCWSA